MAEPLLSIRNLCVDYVTDSGLVRAVDDVSLDVRPSEIVGIAGESGSGKTTLAQALLRILPPPAVISGGEVWFEGADILKMDEPALRTLRWARMSMVFQSAMDSMNPVINVGEQLIDTLAAHTDMSRSDALNRARDLLDMVGIDPRHIDAYAHQLSGGMRQRVGIALALALSPSLVILDEPTTALDVIVERDIFNRIRSLQRELGFSVLFITHDLARMLQVSDRVAVFYAARLAELAPAAELRAGPRHPYTEGLLHAFPSLDPDAPPPMSIPGSPPSLVHPPSGCRFHPRCAQAIDACSRRDPAVREITPNHFVDCRLAD